MRSGSRELEKENRDLRQSSPYFAQAELDHL
jgi:hypothetical protein